MNQVNHPSHYNSGKIEVIEFIEDQGYGPGFCRGNAIKYAARAGKKNPAAEIEDLEKAVWYLKREIETLRAAKEGRTPTRPNAMNPQECSCVGKYHTINCETRPPSISATGALSSNARALPRGFAMSAQSIVLTGEWIDNDHGVTVFISYDNMKRLLGVKGQALFTPEEHERG